MTVEQIYTLMSLYLNICLFAISGCQLRSDSAGLGGQYENIKQIGFHEPMKRELKVHGEGSEVGSRERSGEYIEICCLKFSTNY